MLTISPVYSIRRLSAEFDLMIKLQKKEEEMKKSIGYLEITNRAS